MGFTFDHNERYRVLTDVLAADGAMTVVAAPVVTDHKVVYNISRWLLTNDISINVSTIVHVYTNVGPTQSVSERSQELFSEEEEEEEEDSA